MPLTVIQMIVFSNQILLTFSSYDLCCIILTIRKQIIAFKKGTFAPPAPPTERQEGRLLPPAPLSGVPGARTVVNVPCVTRCKVNWGILSVPLPIRTTKSSYYAESEQASSYCARGFTDQCLFTEKAEAPASCTTIHALHHTTGKA